MLKEEKIRIFKLIFFFTFIVTLVLLPAFLNDRIIVTGDTDDLYYTLPVFEFYGNALKEGDSFLWNSHLFSGFPTYLSQSAGFFDPLNIILFKHLQNIDAYYVRLIIGIVLSLILSYLVGRKFGLSHIASSLIGISYILTFHWRFIGNLLVSNTLFLLPLLFYVYKSFLETDKHKFLWLVLGGVGIGWAFISGNVQFIVYSLTLLGLYSLIYFFWIQEDEKTLKSFLRISIIPLLAIVLIGFVIGLPQILPALEFKNLTIRGDLLDYSLAAQLTVVPGDIIHFLFPDYSYFPYLAPGRKPLHIGVLWFLLSIVGIYTIFKNKLSLIKIRQRKEMMAFFLLFIFALISSIKWSPTFYIMTKLPIYGLFRGPARWMFFGAFFLSILGAYGFDSLREYKPDMILKRIFKFYFTATAFLLSIFVFLNLASHFVLHKLSIFIDSILSSFLYGNFGFTKDPSHYLEAIEKGLLAWKEFNSYGSPQFIIPFLAIIFSSILIYLFIWEKISWDKFRVSVATLVILGFLGIFSAQWQVSISEDVLYYNNQIAERLNLPDKSYRTYTFLTNDGLAKVIKPKFKLTEDELKFAKEFQFISGKPNMHFFSGLYYIDGYDVFLPNEMRKALILLGSGEGAMDETRGLLPEEMIKTLTKNIDILSMMSGKYIVSGEKINISNLKEVDIVYGTEHELPLYIYENRDALPRYYLANNVVSVDSAQFSDLINREGVDFLENTYIKCYPECETNFSSKQDNISIIRERNGEIVLDISVKNNRWMILNESFLPGWYAEIDGIEVVIARANGFYMAILIPEGEHEVRFEYRGLNNELKVLKFLGLVRD
jgi:hypothetical protein